jgi:hypothetical protein
MVLFMYLFISFSSFIFLYLALLLENKNNFLKSNIYLNIIYILIFCQFYYSFGYIFLF